MKAEISQLQEEKGELVKKNADDLESYKEQVRQHSVTICAMEERLSKLNKKSKIFQEEAAALKKSNTGWHLKKNMLCLLSCFNSLIFLDSSVLLICQGNEVNLWKKRMEQELWQTAPMFCFLKMFFFF